ncbi:ATP-binding protein [Enterobacter bugandensis]|uniref:ATP-binding protein n=1 Tax=Enterobacter bugandensis TaxID=881260 RepID=UPI0020753DA3|nr:ATP-binding protein [Enterobacter bugandensis]MCM7277815.1 ATP-binding protein [Enterobacter bugandensis]
MNNELFLNFHGRIIDHLGIQMYQSPTAAIAEMVSNSWDADATKVDILLPTKEDFTITITDNGVGMTFQECQNKFLTVGYDKRKADVTARSKELGRVLMGRKGIGKFAGFGIASIITVTTTSKETGEKTSFSLDIDKIRSTSEGDYVNTSQLIIDVIEREEPNEVNKGLHGTTIKLTGLKIQRGISSEFFAKSMARRFSINASADNFNVNVDGKLIPTENFLALSEMSFPKDYKQEEKPEGLTEIDSDGWGKEMVGEHEIKWRIFFLNDTIKEDDLQGISIFSHNKLAQRPFMFNLTGGLPSQNGPEYMTGSVIADYLDEFEVDVISTERQRLNWGHPNLAILEEWGKARIKNLLRIWKDRRAEEKTKMIEDKISDFGPRMDRLVPTERKIVQNALKKLAGINQLNAEQFKDMGNAILTAWEGGRLKELIRKVAEVPNMDDETLLAMLIEANTIQALHTAESVKSKLDTIIGLEARIQNRELENAVRDYISNHPWLISPKWETFAKERNVSNIAAEAAADSGLDQDEDFNGRVDLVLASGEHLLIMEFMRPGLTIDVSHVNRFETYVDTFRAHLENSTASRFNTATGYLVADKIVKKNPAFLRRVKKLKDDGLETLTWGDLLAEAKRQWQEFLDHLVERSPQDQRLQALVNLESEASNEAENFPEKVTSSENAAS